MRIMHPDPERNSWSGSFDEESGASFHALKGFRKAFAFSCAARREREIGEAMVVALVHRCFVARGGRVCGFGWSDDPQLACISAGGGSGSRLEPRAVAHGAASDRRSLV